MVFLDGFPWDLDWFVVDPDVLHKLTEFVFFSLIDSSAHHSERVIIVTPGKFQLSAITKLNDIIINKLNKHAFFIMFFWIYKNQIKKI